MEAVESLGWGKLERRDGEDVLGPDPKGLPARHDDLEIGRCLEQLGYADCRRGHLLEVVEDQEHLAVSEP